MKSFFATIDTESGTYYIDQKKSVNGVEWFAVMYNSNAVYLNSIQACLDWIESHSEYVLSTAV